MPPLDRALLPAEPPKTGGFNPSALPPNIDTGLEPSAEAANVNVGFFSVELTPKIGAGLEPPVVPPNNDAGLGPSPVLESELVPPKVNTGVLPEAVVPAGTEESVSLAVVMPVDANVGCGGADVEALSPTTTGFAEKFIAEPEGRLELPEVDGVSNDVNLIGSFEPVGAPKIDIGTVDFFTSSAPGTMEGELPSFKPGGVWPNLKTSLA